MTCNISKIEIIQMFVYRRMDEYIIEWSYSRIQYSSENDTTATHIHVDESPTHIE